MRKIFIRTGLVLIWIALIFAIIYWPMVRFFHFEKKTINIFTWGDILDPSIVAQFENETGIKVNLNYYASNEELLVKMKATGGLGYDLIIPSDYAVELLREEDLLKKIDKSKLDFWHRINPALLNHSFDRQNDYSIPFEWEIFGLGINKEYFKDKSFVPSWKMIFDSSVINYKVTMFNDPIEATMIAAYYLFGEIPSLSSSQTERVKTLLMEQRKSVEAYTDFRGDYFLATGNCPVVVSSSSYIFRSIKKFPFIGFVVPEKEGFITIENFSIPKKTNKDALIYAFINYLFTKESIQKHYEAFGFFSSTFNPSTEIDPEMKQVLLMALSNISHFNFFRALLPSQQMRNLWIEVKTP
jgi:spermidine/putrescine transport system substrate-binding protein